MTRKIKFFEHSTLGGLSDAVNAFLEKDDNQAKGWRPLDGVRTGVVTQGGANKNVYLFTLVR